MVEALSCGGRQIGGGGGIEIIFLSNGSAPLLGGAFPRWYSDAYRNPTASASRALMLSG